MKLTARTERSDIVRALGLNAKLIQKADKNVYDQMVYTSKALKKDEKSVTKKDLTDLLREVMKVLGDKFIDHFVVPANAEEKKPVKAETPAPAKKTPAKKESSLKTAKKSAEKKDAPKPVKPEKSNDSEAEIKPADEVKTNPKVAQKAITLAEVFPNSLDIEGEHYLLDTGIKTIKDLHEALAQDAQIVFAIYWTARHLKQFNYFNGYVQKPKSFPNDLDLASCLYVSDSGTLSYALSMYTEGLYTFLPEDFEQTDGIRYSDGMEFQIYRLIPKEVLEHWKAQREARHTPGTVVKSKKGDTIGVIVDKKESKKLTGTPKKKPEAVPAGTVDENGTVRRKTKKTITKK